MKVRRIVANIETLNATAANRFYHDVLGLDILMDQGWIVTYGSEETMQVQVSFMAQGGSGTPVPDLSIEVDDVDATLEAMKAAGFAIEYGPADEPWGVRRFYVRDPLGRLVNILSHR
ncbi:glyoxalase [Mesorhizobium sp. B2-3-13]|uniref:VOC family protein n=1 Tax=unclassified Mesorhizobium TaxID=325217 RepID=UPI0011275899|nr:MULTISPECIES: VOC family protein [unclassified Mesorhizobium]TPJ36678.1 glyoxalase [Mesorhizobium sp. B2-6-5]TPJ77508.1 glyoxalase [Mesorhizobium sp. B2-5-13]TPK43419.1 glyoxalase [Mesorhizobium sp. B2-5-5]TPL73939.1 glyoxalase [Mesorhizobium sp. B2-3-13]TPL96446.1 glyoxalase [Mesorhizobium sp. B2-3-11]